MAGIVGQLHLEIRTMMKSVACWLAMIMEISSFLILGQIRQVKTDIV